MKKSICLLLVFAGTGVLFPQYLHAQDSSGIQKLHTILENLYQEMIPMCSRLIDVGRAVGSFGALWYIGYRVFKHLANAEPIDFFPLFKPFCLAILISLYPQVLSVLNSILKPMVVSTAALANDSNDSVKRMLGERAKNIVNSQEFQTLIGGLGYDDTKDWDKYQQPDEDKSDGLSFGKALKFTFSLVTNSIGFIMKGLLSMLLQVLFYAASLCIDTLRTFHLLILGILGPFVLCLSMYDGFQHILPVWLGRYINIYLWLPISNLFGALIGKIQQGMLQLDINQTNQGDLIGFGATDMAYLVFLVIAIVGYTTIPSIANYVVHASGANALVTNINKTVKMVGSMAISASTGVPVGAGGMTGDIQGPDKAMYPMADAANSEPYFKDGSGSNYQRNQISGNS